MTDAREAADERAPRICPRCQEVCYYDGWDHVHGSGVGIGSCSIDTSPAAPGPLTRQDPA